MPESTTLKALTSKSLEINSLSLQVSLALANLRLLSTLFTPKVSVVM